MLDIHCIMARLRLKKATSLGDAAKISRNTAVYMKPLYRGLQLVFKTLSIGK